VTSGYNSVFPGGIFIGIVESARTEPNKSFLSVKLRLGVDFSRLTYVYVVPAPPHPERDSLEQHALDVPAVKLPAKAATSSTSKPKQP
jgi:rod shape-determining protein MreC